MARYVIAMALGLASILGGGSSIRAAPEGSAMSLGWAHSVRSMPCAQQPTQLFRCFPASREAQAHRLFAAAVSPTLLVERVTGLRLAQVDVEFPTQLRLHANGIAYVFGDAYLVQHGSMPVPRHPGYLLLQQIRGRSFPPNVQVIDGHDGTWFAQASFRRLNLSLSIQGNLGRRVLRHLAQALLQQTG